ncbi:SGNH/GDSL hydrolase family protein [Streptomyces sp. NPDC050504]|uniref:SGNH/GDSL hydrolase family protein n=1 Tax=Streptomyces sp. NPDC050504 TaxID=3365618 RepID=UPI0037AC88F1
MGAGTSSRNSVRGAAVALVSATVLAALPGTAIALDSGHAPHKAASWSGSWAASPQSPAAPFGPNWSQEGFANQTVRQVVRVTKGGAKARIELSNRYGTAPLRIAGATIARTDGGAAVEAGSVRDLTFGHGRALTIPAGGTALSDGVPFEVEAFESVSVTLYLAAPTGPGTFHHTAGAKSFRAAGDHRADRGGEAFKETSESWYFLTGVEVSGGTAGRGAGRGKGVVTFGDSITDGVGSTVDANGRYPDKLAERLAAAGQERAVLNHGISGNQVVNDTTWAGEKGIARFEKDVLNERGIGTVIVLEGINDIGASFQGPPIGGTPEVSARQLIEGHRSLIRQAHARGLKVIGATLTPIKGSFYDDPKGLNEKKRDAVNAWIRGSGEYDAVVDFDRAVADPADRDRLLPVYDSGDKLHPSDAGYVAMAQAIDLSELR